MNRKTAIAAMLSLTMATGQLAFAQGNSNHDRNDRGNDRDQSDHHDNRNQRDHHDNRDFGRSHNEESRKGRGVGPNQQYYRGDRLPSEYRNRNYVVSDWRGHHLSAPPRGYQWVQSGGDYILVSVGSGLILQFNLN